MTLDRRKFLSFLPLLAAPAIVRVESLMQIKPWYELWPEPRPRPPWVLDGAIMDLDFVNARFWPEKFSNELLAKLTE